MAGYFWNTVLAVNGLLWFFCVFFLTYSTGMLIFAGEWKRFVLALSMMVGDTLIEGLLTGLAHD